MVSYIKDFEAFRQLFAPNPPEPSVTNGYALRIFYRTKKEIVQRLLPPPLEVPDDPQVFAYHCYWEQPTFGPGFHESTQFIRAKYQDKEGWYALALYETLDVAVWVGHVLYGTPKKMAEIKLEREGNRVWGTTTRRGIKIISAEMEIKEEQPLREHKESWWFTKYGITENAELEYARVIAVPYRMVEKESYVGNGNIAYEESDIDPVQELQVVQPLTCEYMVYDIYRGVPSLIAKLKPEEYYPYLAAKMIG